jgi:hypothetical protein
MDDYSVMVILFSHSSHSRFQIGFPFPTMRRRSRHFVVAVAVTTTPACPAACLTTRSAVLDGEARRDAMVCSSLTDASVGTSGP